ncbi:MAG: two component transcriptional regulator, LuxR family [Chitinophagaceae bacterium]|nr:two component transcriptional regulator, LuxR family [Chitinophagaceae bacterium]
MLSKENNYRYPQQQNAAFILDNHLLFAESFMCLLKTMNLFAMVLQSNREDDMWKSLKSDPITHLFLDYHIPSLNISDALRKIRKNYKDVKLVVISAAQNIFIAQRMLHCGANALISKSTGITELAVCLHTIAIGRKYISADIQLLMNEHANILHPINFTDKEIQVLQFIANGFTIIKTAELLNVSKHTIIAHRRNMMEKTGVNSATGLVKFGMDAGLIIA